MGLPQRNRVPDPLKIDTMATQDQTMQNAATAAGFSLLKQCSCGGTHVMTYTKRTASGLLELSIRPARASWILKKNNSQVLTGKATELAEKIAAYEVV